MAGEPMSAEDCRAAQRECSAAVRAEMADLRRETKKDIAVIREAVQAIDRNVASIRGYLGLNGNSAPHSHQRRDDSNEREHQRASDSWQVKVMWGVGVAILAVVGNRFINLVFDHVLSGK